MRTAAVGLAILLSGLGSVAHAAQVSDFFGTWRVVRVAGYGDVSSGDKEAQKGVGKSVVISADSIRMPAYLCDKHPVTYQVEDVDAVLASGWEATRKDLDLGRFKLGRRAGHIEATCADGLVLDRDDLLMTSGAGAFYLVRRQ